MGSSSRYRYKRTCIWGSLMWIATAHRTKQKEKASFFGDCSYSNPVFTTFTALLHMSRLH